MLIYFLGWSALIGFTLMVLLIPINTLVMKRLGKDQDNYMAASDERMGVVNEMLQYIRFIKIYSWEDIFAGKIFGIRKRELRSLKNTIYIRSFNSFLWSCSPVFVSMATFGSYTLIFGKTLTAPVRMFNLLIPVLIFYYYYY